MLPNAVGVRREHVADGTYLLVNYNLAFSIFVLTNNAGAVAEIHSSVPACTMPNYNYK